MRTVCAPALATPAAIVPTPASETSLTEISAYSLAHLSPGVAALGEAAAEIYENFDAKTGHMYEIRQRFIDEVTQIPGVTVNGKTGRDSAPQIVSVTIEDVRSEVMLHSLEEYGIYVSAGSACSSNKPAPSRTLQGIGLPKQKLESTIRISFCVNTTEEEVDYAVEKMKEIIPFRRKFTRK